MSANKQTKGFLWGALAGGIVGSVTALLLAPKSGKEMRHDLSVGAQKVGDATLRAASQVGDTTGRVARQIGEQAIDIADKARQVGGNVAETVRSWRRDDETEELAAVSGISDEPLEIVLPNDDEEEQETLRS